MGELLKQEEQRRRMAEMRKYLDKQVHERQVKEQRNKEFDRCEKPIDDPATLPMGTEIDPEEEQYVKMALRRALEQQVVEKEEDRKATKAGDLKEQQHVLNCVAHEMQQARYRELSQRRDRSDMLNSTWAKQDELKKRELALDKAL